MGTLRPDVGVVKVLAREALRTFWPEVRRFGATIKPATSSSFSLGGIGNDEPDDHSATTTADAVAILGNFGLIRGGFLQWRIYRYEHAFLGAEAGTTAFIYLRSSRELRLQR